MLLSRFRLDVFQDIINKAESYGLDVVAIREKNGLRRDRFG
jgi:hypothetical protein